MNKDIIDDLAKGSVEAFNLGVQVERERIMAILKDNVYGEAVELIKANS